MATTRSKSSINTNHTNESNNKKARYNNTKHGNNFKREINLKNTGSAAIDKLSHVTLNDEQVSLKKKILEFISTNLDNYKDNDGTCAMFVIQGDAGTGKSVVLNALFNDIQKIAETKNLKEVEKDFPPHVIKSLEHTKNYLVVNHPEMLKLYHRISKSFRYINKSSLERPTSLINMLTKSKSKCDVVIIDEAHLLSTSKDAFKRFYGENHLQDLMSLSKVLIIVFDEKQSLRMGSFWGQTSERNGASLSTFYDALPANKKSWYYLKQQFRVVAEPDMLQWIEKISTTGEILPFPQSVKTKEKSNFDFKIWSDCGAMYEDLKEKNKQFGQCRMLATYDFPYRLDGKDYFVTCGDNFKLRWDRYTPKAITPWSERDDTIDEVGSVYTIQGFDLNYAGLILGRSVGYDKETDSIKLKPEYYDDHAGFTKKKNIKDVDLVKHKIIMNSINVLMTRGVKGMYLYAWDPELRERLLGLT
ncbi:uncharacterized protein SCDLUD_001163 [Saccharomycodes ludwigii]|uniref:uncharacterized protein n=1 Tax=Saccharomycodes ludwigii TaxID=36035 RepID=UPI001E8C3029|nr:hypothetical protein SCDLUD_001163 [Saccharomycodes ludwigii]KAH3903522.1 hypothetical protein SCDLUD_001163 [Saccharomycodes ludwigii]